MSSASLLNLYIKRVIASNTDTSFFPFLMKEVYTRLPLKKSLITVDIFPSRKILITCRADNRILKINKKNLHAKI